MRTVHSVILHHSGSDLDTPAGIRAFHTAKPPRGRGWVDIAYSWLMTADGAWKTGRPYTKVPASNGYGSNAGTVSVAILGDYSDKLLSPEAYAELVAGLLRIQARLRGEGQIIRRLRPHSDFRPTDCPGRLREYLPELREALGLEGDQ